MVEYSIQQFKKDLFNAMISRPGKFSGRALGDTTKQKLWTDEKIKQMYNGILTAHRIYFYSVLDLADYAHLMISESMQESTGDYRLGCTGKIDFTDHTSHGIIQVTPGSILKDYYTWGKPIMDITGKLIVNPSTIHDIDLSNPGICVIIWAWYTKNSVLMRMSMNEYGFREKWYSVPSQVVPDIGNCMLTHLAGPRHNRHIDNKPFEDYYLRILDYYVASGFGTKEKFDSLIDTIITTDIKGVYDTSDSRINNRDTFIGIECVKQST